LARAGRPRLVAAELVLSAEMQKKEGGGEEKKKKMKEARYVARGSGGFGARRKIINLLCSVIYFTGKLQMKP